MKKKCIIKSSLEEGTNIRKMAQAVAKKQIIEDLTKPIRKLVEKQIKNVKQTSEDSDRLRRAADGYGETPFEEGSDLPKGKQTMADKKDDLEFEGMFPHLSEMEDEMEDEMDEMSQEEQMPFDEMAYEDDEQELKPEMSIPTLGEGEEGDMDDMDEEISIDEAELKKAYESIMALHAGLSEASVTSGFADSYPKSEWETEESPPSDTGLMDKESGEKAWDERRPRAAADHTVKESIRRSLRENPHLGQYVRHVEGQLRAAKSIVGKLKEEVANVNLFNMKVLRVNEMLNRFGGNLTRKQKKVVVERIDRARTVREVKMVAEALNASFRATGTSLKENKKRRRRAPAPAGGSRMTRPGTPNQKILRESVNKSASAAGDRMLVLAGLK